MRIAYAITRSDAVGGASIHVRDLAREMQTRGHETLVLVGGEGAVTSQLRAAGVPYRALRHLQRAIHPAADCRACQELRSALREWRPDILSAHTAKAGWLARAAARRLDLPVLYTPHGWTVGDRLGRLRGIAFGWAEKIASRWCDAIVCVCEYERQLAISRRIAPPGLLRVIHNGVHDVPDELRAHPGAGPARIVCVARLERPKDHQTLIRALAGLRDLDWVLELIGDGPLENSIRRTAGRLGLAGRVIFSGYQADPAAALARAQIFVLSSLSEGFPRSVLEAMRAGLPVVASDVGGIGEAVKDGVNGRLVPPGSVPALSSALAALLADPSERERWGAAGYNIFRSQFRFRRMADSTERLYAETRNSRIASPES
ncbi:MAG: glycosyltransferase family 4 protein [Bryobacteraceae bacterium]